MTISTARTTRTTPTGRPRATSLVSLFGGVVGGGTGLVLLFANPIAGGGSGAAVTAALSDNATLLQALAILSVYAGAALLVSADVLGRAVAGAHGRVVATAGAAVAMLMVAYQAAFGGGAIVASLLLDSPGPGLGEATLLGVNLVEVTRYAPSLALVVATLLARRELPKPVGLSALALAMLLVLPLTSWIGAILTPLWLGLSAASVARRS